MTNLPQIAGRLDGSGRRFAIVASLFNERLVAMLLEGAQQSLLDHGVAATDLQIVRVPGAWELPQAAEEIAAAGRTDAIVVLGAVIRGQTPHFDHLCAECARGLGNVSSKYRLPVSFGVLTCDTIEQAEERAGGRVGNKGIEAAEAALEMADVFSRLRT